MNPFDAGILHFLNQFAQRSWHFDKTMVFASTDSFVTGGIATAFFWWAWFRKSNSERRQREFVISGLALSCVALFVARTLAELLPFRARPYLNPVLHFRPPHGTAEYYFDLIHWSSFPSDHAVLYFSLATCIFLVSRKAGTLSYLHTFFVVCVPLVYLGEHYPTDILAGAALGIGIASLSLVERLRKGISHFPLKFHEYSSTGFYTCAYLITFLFATNFDSVRKICFYAFNTLFGSGHGHF